MTKTLLVINDLPLRQQGFKSAQKILKKIDRVEASLSSFQQKDQKLFERWFESTFSEQRAQIQSLQGEFRDLVQFHNWVVAASDQMNLPLYEAYRFIKMEEEEYRRGGPEVRARIEKEREARERYLEEETRNEEEARASKDKRKHSVYEQELFTRIWDMDDEELGAICEDEDVAFEFLAMTLRLCASPDDYELFIRVWEAVPQRHRAAMNEAFELKHGVSIEEAVEQMREAMRPPEQPEFDDGSELPPTEEERLKILYRKLVRRLHPDLRANDGEGLWRRRLWEKAQAAYQEKDVRRIENLLRLTALRDRELHDLTLSEIIESCRWLESELDQLKSETKQLRRLPAWNFSRGKNLELLKKRLLKDFDRDAVNLQSQITSLRREHARLERMIAACDY